MSHLVSVASHLQTLIDHPSWVMTIDRYEDVSLGYVSSKSDVIMFSLSYL